MLHLKIFICTPARVALGSHMLLRQPVRVAFKGALFSRGFAIREFAWRE